MKETNFMFFYWSKANTLVLHHHLHELPYELFVEEDIKDKKDY